MLKWPGKLVVVLLISTSMNWDRAVGKSTRLLMGHDHHPKYEQLGPHETIPRLFFSREGRSSEQNATAFQFCSRRLLNSLKYFCNNDGLYNQEATSNQNKQGRSVPQQNRREDYRRQSRGVAIGGRDTGIAKVPETYRNIVEECCHNACSRERFQEYCKQIRREDPKPATTTTTPPPPPSSFGTHRFLRTRDDNNGIGNGIRPSTSSINFPIARDSQQSQELRQQPIQEILKCLLNPNCMDAGSLIIPKRFKNRRDKKIKPFQTKICDTGLKNRSSKAGQQIQRRRKEEESIQDAVKIFFDWLSWWAYEAKNFGPYSNVNIYDVDDVQTGPSQDAAEQRFQVQGGDSPNYREVTIPPTRLSNSISFSYGTDDGANLNNNF